MLGQRRFNLDVPVPSAITPSEVTKHGAAQALVDGRDLERFFGGAVARGLLAAAETRAKAQVLGDGPRWLGAIADLERLGPATWDASGPAPRIAAPELDNLPGLGGSEAHSHPVGADLQARVQALLGELCPWRKGPFDVCGVPLDAEWRCDRKWTRVNSAVSFAGKTLLDVGCGNGYYLLRALGAGARMALGIDPTWLYVAQFGALRRLINPRGGDLGFASPPPLPAWVLPLGLEDLAGLDEQPQADVVMSMGVLYHRKSPIEHLEALRPLLRPGATLVLETLVVAGDERTVLVPEDRYAAMRNVWMIPSVAAAQRWLARCGYRDVTVVDVSATTPDEQRATDFMQSASLRDFLDPREPGLTIEGYPAPTRAVFTARLGS